MAVKTAQFIVRVPFDDRHVKGLEQTPVWCRYRIKLFEEFTLRSLLNQNFRNFRIFLICGERNREMKESHDWHPKVELCYDTGRKKYDEIEADYVSITRVDSDDLLHRDALTEIRDSLIFSEKRECLVFLKHWLWSVPAGLLAHRTYHDPAPPYYTHIFPRKIFKDWPEFDRQHNVGHGHAGGDLCGTKALSPWKVCVVKHWANTGRIKRGKPLVTNRKGSNKNGNGMFKVLQDFGIQRYQMSCDYKIEWKET